MFAVFSVLDGRSGRTLCAVWSQLARLAQLLSWCWEETEPQVQAGLQQGVRGGLVGALWTHTEVLISIAPSRSVVTPPCCSWFMPMGCGARSVALGPGRLWLQSEQSSLHSPPTCTLPVVPCVCRP